jgi:hypothetical protein
MRFEKAFDLFLPPDVQIDIILFSLLVSRCYIGRSVIIAVENAVPYEAPPDVLREHH